MIYVIAQPISIGIVDIHIRSFNDCLTRRTIMGLSYDVTILHVLSARRLETLEYIDLETTYRLRHISGGGELGSWKFQPPLHTST